MNKWKTPAGQKIVCECSVESMIDALAKASTTADVKRAEFLCSELLQKVRDRQSALAR